MGSSIKLRVINLSNDGGQSNVVFFQENDSLERGAVIAWKVVKNCGYGNYHPINYGIDNEINMVDWNANHSIRQFAAYGQGFNIVQRSYGKQLLAVSRDNSSTEVSVQNMLRKGALQVNLYRSGCLVEQYPNLIPGQVKTFSLRHRLRVAVIPNIRQGETIPLSVLPACSKAIWVDGLESADIIMQNGVEENGRFSVDFKMKSIVMK